MNKLKNTRYLLLLVFVTVLLLPACKSTEKILKRPLKERGFEFLYSNMKKNQIKPEYLSAKLNVTYYEEGKSKTEFKGQLRMKADSIIWLSVSPALGIEALRIELTQDSIKLINRLNKTWLAGNFNLIDSLIHTTINYNIVEAMLLGNDISQYVVEKYKVKIDDNLYKINIQKRKKLKRFIRNSDSKPKVIVQNIWIDPFTYRIRKMNLKELDDNSTSLTVLYDDYSEINGRLLPFSIIIDIHAKKNLEVKIEYRKPVIDKSLTFPFRIPSKYQKIE